MEDQTLIYVDEQYEVTTSLDINAFDHAKNVTEIAYGLFWNFIVNAGLTKDEALARAEGFEIFISNKHKELVASIKAE